MCHRTPRRSRRDRRRPRAAPYRPAGAVVLNIAPCPGEMTEWPKVPDSKSGLGASPTWVRLPLSPPHVPLFSRRDDRVAEGARLEIVCTATYRGFESLSLL